MAIKVTISTLTAVREDLPRHLIGNSEHSLQNIQSIANPVPNYLFDTEYWPEVDDTPVFDPRTHIKGAETLVADAGTKTVSSVFALEEKPLPEVKQHCRQVVRNKMIISLGGNIDIGDGVISNLAELTENRDLLDGSAPSELNLASGPVRLSLAKQTAAKSRMKAHRRGSHSRAHAILDLIKAETTGLGKVAVLDAQLDSGWP